MMMAAVLCLAAMPIAGCATVPIGAGSTTIAKVEAGYRAARAIAEIFAPFLPDAQRARLDALSAEIERAIATARFAATIAEQLRALREAEAAAAEYRAAAGA